MKQYLKLMVGFLRLLQLAIMLWQFKEKHIFTIL